MPCSGKRKVKLIGTHLEFVDGLMQSHAQHQVLLPRNSSSLEVVLQTVCGEYIFKGTILNPRSNYK